jgi:hypothetical protein
VQIKLDSKLKMHKTSLLLIAVAAAFVLSLLAAPVSSVSTNQCNSCHGNYNQQIDLLEASSSIPSTLQVGQTIPVTVVIQNINNVPRYNQLSSVAVTLRSQNGHFSVNSQTYNIGLLSTGTATATWQIAGVSAGADQFVISATARNTHENIMLNDNYSPNPSITVMASAAITPTPVTPTPTPTPTTNPTQNPIPTATVSESSTPNPTQSPTSSAIQNPTPSPEPTTSTSPTATPNTPANPTETPDPSTDPTSTPATTNDHIDQLNSTMLYIHPPLSIAGYVFIFILTALTIKAGMSKSKLTTISALAAWVLTALGLFTGMLWAQVAWGSYWSWDIKETLTLALFLALSAGQVAYFERKPEAAKWLLVVTCVLVIITASSSFIVAGLHSYL